MIKRTNILKMLIASVCMILLPLPLLLLINNWVSGKFTTYSFSLGVGTIAYVWILFIIYLGTKPKWLDRLIGLPNIYFLHSIMAVASVILFFFHIYLSTGGGLVGLLGEIGAYIFTGVTIVSLIYFSGWFSHEILIVSKVRKLIKRFINYEVFIWFHRVTLIGALAIFLHVSFLEYIRDIPGFFPLFVVYTIIPFFAYFKMIFNYYIKPRVGQVKEVTRLDQNLIKIVIEAESKYLSKIKEDQFVYVAFPNKDKLKSYHPFTIASKNENSFTLVIIEIGDFTKSVISLQKGDKVIYSKFYTNLSDITDKMTKI